MPSRLCFHLLIDVTAYDVTSVSSYQRSLSILHSINIAFNMHMGDTFHVLYCLVDYVLYMLLRVGRFAKAINRGVYINLTLSHFHMQYEFMLGE